MGAKQLTEAAESIAEDLIPELAEKTYSSGKEGFFAQAKLTVDGKRYQAQIMPVEIQPK